MKSYSDSKHIIEKRNLDLSTLAEISETLSTTYDTDQITDLMLLMPMGRMMIRRALFIQKISSTSYRIAKVKGMSQEYTGRQFEHDAPLTKAASLRTTSVRSPLFEFLIRQKSELIIPLVARSMVRGLLAFGDKADETEYSRQEIMFLSSMAHIAATALENAQRIDELQKLNLQLDRKIQQLNTLFEIGKELSQMYDANQILHRMALSLMGQFFVNQFFVILDIDNRISVAYKQGSRFKGDSLTVQLPRLKHFFELSAPSQISDLPEAESIAELGIHLIVPMQRQNENGGVLFVGQKMDRKEFSPDDLDFISTLANITMLSVDNAHMIRQMVEKRRLEDELKLAHSIQQKLLPAEMPQIESYDIHGLNIPSTEVGGDYFDIFPLNQNEYIFTVADVSGKGLPAAILMANLQAGLHALCTQPMSLGEITFRLNNLIYKNTSIEKYITFFILKLDIPSGRFEYVNAGHNPPYIFKDRRLEKTLDEGGLILGMMPDVVYQQGTGILQPNSCLTLFTDGVTESMTTENIEFEEKRVIEFFRSTLGTKSSRELNETLIATLKEFSGNQPVNNDDITILTVQRRS